MREEARDGLEGRGPVVEEDQVEGVGAETFTDCRGAAGRMALGGGRERRCQRLADPEVVITNETSAGGRHQ
jgi:hypothetical protein